MTLWVTYLRPSPPPCFACHCVCDSSISFFWISSHTTISAWEPSGDDSPVSTVRTPRCGWGPQGDIMSHRWLCVCSKGGWQRAEPRVGLAWRTVRHSSTEGKVSCPFSQELIHVWAGLYVLRSPNNFAGGAFLHSGIVYLPKRSRKDLWGRTEKEEKNPHKNRTLGSQNNLSFPVVLGDNWRVL